MEVPPLGVGSEEGGIEEGVGRSVEYLGVGGSVEGEDVGEATGDDGTDTGVDGAEGVEGIEVGVGDVGMSVEEVEVGGSAKDEDVGKATGDDGTGAGVFVFSPFCLCSLSSSVVSVSSSLFASSTTIEWDAIVSLLPFWDPTPLAVFAVTVVVVFVVRGGRADVEAETVVWPPPSASVVAVGAFASTSVMAFVPLLAVMGVPETGRLAAPI